TIGLVADVYDASGAAALLGLGPSDFGRHTQSGFDGGAHLQRRRGRKEKTAARGIQGFGEGFGLDWCCSYSAKPQRGAGIEAGNLAAFCNGFHVEPPFGGAISSSG